MKFYSKALKKFPVIKVNEEMCICEENFRLVISKDNINRMIKFPSVNKLDFYLK